MKSKLILIGSMIALLSFTSAKGKCPADSMRKVNEDCTRTEVRDTIPQKSTKIRSSNEERFSEWTNEKWLDNDYIRSLRKLLDDYHGGKISDDHIVKPSLDEYKDDIKGQFMIVNIQAHLMGGVDIAICFIEKPTKAYRVWVYREVDEVNQTYNYACRGFDLTKAKLNYTKEQLLEIIKEHPELRPW